MVELIRGNMKLLIIFILIVFPISLFGDERGVLQLRWDHQFQFAGYYAAKIKGFYKDVGLNVEIKSGILEDGTVVSAVEEVQSGRADFGIGATDILIAYDKGYDLTIISSIF